MPILRSTVLGDIPTEQAVTTFGIVGGVANAAAQIVAARRLSQFPSSDIPVQTLFLPVAFGMAGTILGAFLVPRS